MSEDHKCCLAAGIRTGVLDEIEAERSRQIAKGYDAAHDDEHTNGCIAWAASAYAGRTFWKSQPAPLYPWGEMPERGTVRDDLITAAALIVAEIERLDRFKTADTVNIRKPE